jgi:hypothetical protein
MTFENEHLTRQLDIIPMKILDTPITVIGCGAIGSWTTLALAKMGFQDLSIWDMDDVDTVNLNSQFYPTGFVGRPKTFALWDLVKMFTGVDVAVAGRKAPDPERGWDLASWRHEYTDQVFPGIVITAVDSMTVRKAVFKAHRSGGIHTRAVIDPRMGAESALLHVYQPMNPSDAASYEKSLYDDSEALQERCTAKATIYTANMLSGLVCKAVKDVLTREDYLRNAQWDIAANEFLGFRRKVETDAARASP